MIVDTVLADQAVAAGACRHTPVASNHFADAVHGTRIIHSSSHGACESIAVLFPDDVTDDPTAGLWWVLVDDIIAPGLRYETDPRAGQQIADERTRRRLAEQPGARQDI